MHKAKAITSQFRIITLFLLLLIFSGSLFFYDVKYQANDFRSLIQTNISIPIKTAVNWPRILWNNMTVFFSKQSVLLAENKQQKKEIIWLKANIANLTTIEAENTRLKLLLDSTVVRNRPVVIAEIIDSQVDESKHQLEINKGSKQHTAIGQIAVDEKGIIGQVTKVFQNTSIVSLITDPVQHVPVYIERNRLRMVSSGTGRLDELKVDFVSLDADIKVGDKLITSGLGGRYPRGYILGIITKVEKLPINQFTSVTAKPVASLDKALEVLLIRSDKEQLNSSIN